MFDLEANQEDVKSIADRLEKMKDKLDHFGKVQLGEIMSDWQTKEMHRHRPFTMRWRGKKRQVQTVVRPHSLYEMKGERKRVVRAHRRHVAPPRHWSTRPILRAELETQLFNEMNDAFHDAINW